VKFLEVVQVRSTSLSQLLPFIEKLVGGEPSQPSEPPQYSVFSCKWEIWGDSWGTIKEPSEPSLLSGGAGIQALI